MTTVYIYSVFCVVCFLCFVVLLLEKDVVKMADEKRIEFVCITVLGVREMREICRKMLYCLGTNVDTMEKMKGEF